MAKIIKVGSQNLTPHKIANPFKTSRNSTTNPFKYSNFEGNTLPFELAADVFETKSTNKLRMIASSVAGSMNKMRSSIAEPIINFVKRVGGGISQAWNYATETSFSTAMSDAATSIRENVSGAVNSIREHEKVRAIHEALNKEVHIPGMDKVTSILNTEVHLPSLPAMPSMKNISSHFEFLNKEIHMPSLEIGKNMSEKWAALVSKIQPRRISADMSVEELETLWKEEIALGGAV